MVNSGMLICSFFLKKRFQRGDEELLPLNAEYDYEVENDCNNHFGSAIDLFKKFCEESVQGSDDEKAMKLFAIEDSSFITYQHASYSALSFVVNSGSYGIESEITDRKTGNVNYVCTENDAPGIYFSESVLSFNPIP
ncbi:MAG: hypothetical protein MJ177_09225 [Clostridia bacterium]|nr:hypothetical protein [Clostridia bacterium]